MADLTDPNFNVACCPATHILADHSFASMYVKILQGDVLQPLFGQAHDVDGCAGPLAGYVSVRRSRTTKATFTAMTSLSCSKS